MSSELFDVPGMKTIANSTCYFSFPSFVYIVFIFCWQNLFLWVKYSLLCMKKTGKSYNASELLAIKNIDSPKPICNGFKCEQENRISKSSWCVN